MKSLHAKMAEISSAIGRVPKRGTNKFHGYDYATEADISEAIRSELSSRGIAVYTSSKLTESKEWWTPKEKRTLITFVEVSITFVDAESGEERTITSVGAGDDSSDKGPYKAITGAVKYALMKTFLMPTGDDPEGSDAEGANTAKSAPPARTKPEPVVVSPEDGKYVDAIVKVSALVGGNVNSAARWAASKPDKAQALGVAVQQATEKGFDAKAVAKALKGSEKDVIAMVKQMFDAVEVTNGKAD